MLGTDILLRHKAIINCRTKFVFFKIDRSRPLQLASVALPEKFTQVPLQQEENGAFTVPCSVHRQSGRLLVDTGAFITTFNEATLKSLGIALQPAQASARFTNGVARRISVGQISDFTIGDFKVPPAKFGAAALPNFSLRQGNTRTNGSDTYLYDVENRLTNAIVGGTNITIIYDGDGNRVKKTVGTTTNFYLIDNRNPSGYP